MSCMVVTYLAVSAHLNLQRATYVNTCLRCGTYGYTCARAHSGAALGSLLYSALLLAGDESLLLDPVTIFRPATIVTAALSDVQ